MREHAATFQNSRLIGPVCAARSAPIIFFELARRISLDIRISAMGRCFSSPRAIFIARGRDVQRFKPGVDQLLDHFEFAFVSSAVPARSSLFSTTFDSRYF